MFPRSIGECADPTPASKFKVPLDVEMLSALFAGMARRLDDTVLNLSWHFGGRLPRPGRQTHLDRCAGHERNMLSQGPVSTVHVRYWTGHPRELPAGRPRYLGTQRERIHVVKSQSVISQPSPSQPSGCGRPIDHDLRAAAHRPSPLALFYRADQ
jgi:hypothetical protein